MKGDSRMLKKIETHLRLDEEQYEALHQACLRKKLSKSAAIAEAIARWLAAEKEPGDEPPRLKVTTEEERRVDLYLNFLRHGESAVVDTITSAVEGHVRAGRS
jgi:hypothetical protein